jgi:hypothetical protein
MNFRLGELVDRIFASGSYSVAVSASERREVVDGVRELFAIIEGLRAGLESIMVDPPGGDGESNREWCVALRGLLVSFGVAGRPVLSMEHRDLLSRSIVRWRRLGQRWTSDLASAVHQALCVVDGGAGERMTLGQRSCLRFSSEFLMSSGGTEVGAALRDLLAACDARAPSP